MHPSQKNASGPQSLHQIHAGVVLQKVQIAPAGKPSDTILVGTSLLRTAAQASIRCSLRVS